MVSKNNKLIPIRSKINPQDLQDTICNFFIQSTKTNPPDLVLKKFDNLFISQIQREHPEIYHALYSLVRLNQEPIFRSTLKRCCYILINNWNAARNQQYREELIQLFSKLPEENKNLPTAQQRLKKWLKNFFYSEDYQELSLMVSKYSDRDARWSNRYASYLLASQYLDYKKPPEQRQAARDLSHQLKEQFNYDLAMYTARSQLAVTSAIPYQNPTALGDDVRSLIQKILAKRGKFSNPSLANIFLKQVDGFIYKQFKRSFFKYLIYSLENHEILESSGISLSGYITLLYQEHNEKKWDSHLLLRTCNRVIEYLTIEKPDRPSTVFTLLAIQGQAYTLTLLLLKIILISKNSYTHLEACIGYLIQFYEHYPESDCEWLISFLETVKVTLAIYVENVRYNLVNVDGDRPKIQNNDSLNSYWVFSQVKLDRKSDATDGEITPDL